MTVRELTGIMWYIQKVRLVTGVDHYLTNVEEKTLFYGENCEFRSEVNKKYLNYKVISYGVIDGDVVIEVKQDK